MLKKLSTVLGKSKKKISMMLALTAIMVFSVTSMAFAADPTPAAIDLDPVKTAILGSVSTSQIVTVIAAVIAGGMSFVLLWWGARKLFRAIMSAFKKGKLSI